MACNHVSIPAPRGELGAWLVYWQAESGLAELEAHGRLFQQVSLFAYELDEGCAPQPAPELSEITPRFLALAKEQGFEPWVTVVNDVRLANGKMTLKDTAVLEKVLRERETRQAHIQALTELVKSNGFAGLTLDYEDLGKLSEVQQDNFRALVTELAQGLAKNNLGLNVVVEPRRGPLPRPGAARLIVMAYNLHGPHSSPGPRCTPSFIAGLEKRGEGDAREAPAIALAVAGFLWAPEGGAKEVSWNAAPQMLQTAAKVGRSWPDNCPYARFPDHSELWFEDPESLKNSWQAAQQAGFRDLWLWHLGGNDERLFQWLGVVWPPRPYGDPTTKITKE